MKLETGQKIVAKTWRKSAKYRILFYGVRVEEDKNRLVERVIEFALSVRIIMGYFILLIFSPLGLLFYIFILNCLLDIKRL